jgi:hypothetical protein
MGHEDIHEQEGREDDLSGAKNNQLPIVQKS